MLGLDQAALLDRARAGDRDAFAQLFDQIERPLAAFLFRLIAERQDAEDLAQETVLLAIETIGQSQGASSFRTWIFGLGAQAALEYLRGRKQWDPDAQIRAAYKASGNPGIGRRLLQLHKSRLHTTYNIREHIDFCFTCMGRCLAPHEAAALLLVDVHGFSHEEAAKTLGATAQAIAFRVEQARQALVKHYEERCSLINKNGLCSQCAGLDTMFYKDRRHTEQALFQITLQQQPTAVERAATFPQRLAIVRAIDPIHAEGAKLHEVMMTMTRQANGYE